MEDLKLLSTLPIGATFDFRHKIRGGIDPAYIDKLTVYKKIGQDSEIIVIKNADTGYNNESYFLAPTILVTHS